MKCLYISYDGALDPLGQSQIIPYLKGLAGKGCFFTLLTFEKKKLKTRERIENQSRELFNHNIKWKYLNYHKRPTVPATLYDIFLGFLAASWIIKKEKVSIVHGRTFIGAIIGLLLKKLFNVNFLLDIRGLWPDERVDGQIFKKDSFLYRFSKYTEKSLILNADEIVVLTREVEKIIINFPYLYDKKISINVIPTCTDLNLFRPQKKSRKILDNLDLENKFIFLYLGSLGTWYLLEEMLDFFLSAKKIHSNAHILFLTQTDPYVIIDAAKKIGISDTEFSIKGVSYKDARKWISVSNVSLFFIKPLFSKKSSCPTKFGESLACGLPVIINSGIGDCDDIVLNEKVGVVINGFSKSEYIKASKELNELLSEGDALRERCRRVAQKYFSLESGIESYWNIYSRLIGRESSYAPNKKTN